MLLEDEPHHWKKTATFRARYKPGRSLREQWAGRSELTVAQHVPRRRVARGGTGVPEGLRKGSMLMFLRSNNVSKTIINCHYFDGLYQTFVVKLGLVYRCLTNLLAAWRCFLHRVVLFWSGSWFQYILIYTVRKYSWKFSGHEIPGLWNPHFLPSMPYFQTHCCCPMLFLLFPSVSSWGLQPSSGVHWCRRRVRFNEVPEKVPKVPEKVWETLVQSQVRFNRFRRRFQRWFQETLVKAKPGSTGSGESCREGPGEGFGNLWCKARSGSTGSTGFPALSFAAHFRKICKNKTLRLLGIPLKLIFCWYQASTIWHEQRQVSIYIYIYTYDM